MAYKTRAEARGVKLDFTTVDEALAFGEKRLMEYLEQKQQLQLEAQQPSLMQNQGSYQGESESNPLELVLDDMEAINFNDFLSEYIDTLEKNLDGVERSDLSPQQLLEKEEADRENDFDIDDDLDDNVGESDISDTRLKRKNEKKKSSSKLKSDKQSKKKVIKASQNQQKNNRERASLDKIETKVKTKKVIKAVERQNQEKSSERTKKVITARNIEIVAKNPTTGQDISRQVEKVGTQRVGEDKAKGQSKARVESPLAKKLEAAKFSIIAEKMAKVTFLTGRSIELSVGKDKLSFSIDRNNDNSVFAYKNGKAIPLQEAGGMLAKLNKELSREGKDFLGVFADRIAKNPAMKTLHDARQVVSKDDNQEKQIKVVKTQQDRG